MMSRRGLLGGAAMGLLAARSPTWAQSVHPRTFYISAVGDDAGDGLSPSTTWRTLEKVAASNFRPGDRILFRCGDTFYGQLAVPGAHFAAADRPVFAGAYGGSHANLPVLSFYKGVKPSAWVGQGGGVWRAPINDPSAITGNTGVVGASGANIGHLNVDGVIYSALQTSLGALRNDWDFYSDGSTYLYVKSATNPGSRASSVQAAPDGQHIRSRGSLALRDLIIEGSGGVATSFNNKSAVDVQWCWFRRVGGSIQNGGGGVRYGNAVQFWVGGSNCIASNNLFTDVYDTATTCQGFPVINAGDGWFNVAINDNIAARCSQAFEFWNRRGRRASVSAPAAGSGMSNVRSLRWTLFDMQQGGLVTAGHADPAILAAFLMYYVEAPLADVRVSVSSMRNCPGLLLANPHYDVQAIPPGFVIQPSALTMTSGQQIQTGYPQTAAQFGSWVADSGLAAGSTMTIDNSPKQAVSDDYLFRFWRSRRPRLSPLG